MESNSNKKAQDLIKEENVSFDGKNYAKGSEAFVDFFNNMAGEAKRKAQKEADKPQYRFLSTWNDEDGCSNDSLLTQNTSEAAETINEISDLQEKIHDMDYSVQIIENLDCINVTEESRYFIRIAHNNGVYVDIDLFEYEKRIKDFSFNENEYIAEQISKIEGSITKEVTQLAECAVEYLSYIIYFKSLYTMVYKKIGWEYYDWNTKGWIFKYDKIYSKIPLLHGRGLNKYTEELQRVKDDTGEKEIEWVLSAIKLINNHAFDALIIGAGISGLVRQLLPYTKETNINVNIMGKPASGKSIICHYLLGIFGNPELIEGSYLDTENATEQKRVSRAVLPYVSDDRMLKIETDSEKMKQQKIVADIFREYEGKVKDRFGKQYEDESGNRTYGPVISSSVRSMLDYLFKSEDLGQYRRFMEFNVGDKNSKVIFSDADEAKFYEEIAYKNYGIGIEIIVEYMFELLCGEGKDDSDANKLIERFNDIDKFVAKALNEREGEEYKKAKENGTNSRVRNLDSSSKRFALIILSYQIFRESLIYYNYRKMQEVKFNDLQEVPDEKCEHVESYKKSGTFVEYLENQTILKDSSKEILEILTDNLVEKVNKINKEVGGNQLYNYILENEKNGAFIRTDEFNSDMLQKLLESKGEILGYFVVDDEQTITLNTARNFALGYFWEMYKIPSVDVIREYCHKVLENGMDRKRAIALGQKEYDTVSLISKIKHSDSNRTISGKAVRFDICKVEIPNKGDEE